MQGELKPNSHCNIKMTLIPAKYPTNFEGEIQCSIDWDMDAETKGGMDAKSVHTTTAAGLEASEATSCVSLGPRLGCMARRRANATRAGIF